MDEWSEYTLAEDTWVVAWANYITQYAVFETEQLRQQAIMVIRYLFAAIEQGNSCLKIPPSDVQPLGGLVSDQPSTHVTPFIYQHDLLYLYRHFILEQRLAKQVQRLSRQTVAPCDSRPYHELLTDTYQQHALICVSHSALSLITGGPGTGKTYTLARIIAVLNKTIPNLRIAMAAPTGKAAQRMQEALQYAFSDHDLVARDLVTPALKMIQPTTLHRLLNIGRQGRASYHLQQPLPYDVVVVDEASMLDLNLATQLFEAIDDQTRLILLGDANQLTSVDVGAVLADLQTVPALKNQHVILKHSRRFTSDAEIGQFARFIQQSNTSDAVHIRQLFEQKVTKPTTIQPIDLQRITVDQVQFEYLPAQWRDSGQKTEYLNRLWYGFEQYAVAVTAYCHQPSDTHAFDRVIQCFDDYRILTAMHYGDFGVQRLNQYMEQQLLSELPSTHVRQGDWYVGRPVMVTENNYQLGLSNGDIGICFQHRQHHTQFEVYFPSLNVWVLATRLPKTIQTAFAMTIHKSQGSEFTHTAVVLEQAAAKLMSQELLYTAITRAKKVVTFLADETTLSSALLQRTVRQSGFLYHFSSEFN